jgi:hypothetical protein
MARRGQKKLGSTAVWNLLQEGMEITRMVLAAVGEGKRETDGAREE